MRWARSYSHGDSVNRRRRDNSVFRTSGTSALHVLLYEYRGLRLKTFSGNFLARQRRACFLPSITPSQPLHCLVTSATRTNPTQPNRPDLQLALTGVVWLLCIRRVGSMRAEIAAHVDGRERQLREMQQDPERQDAADSSVDSVHLEEQEAAAAARISAARMSRLA